jgi:RimJ/RimL family protein N-acetyltransferase
MQSIRTARLELRTFTVADITDAYVAALNDQHIVGQTEARHQKWDYSSTSAYVERSNVAGVSELIGVFLAEDGAHLGNVRLSGFNNRHVELGIMLHASQFWGQGYATEALGAVCDHVFNTLKLHKICADYHATNHASAKMFVKSGFVTEGIFKEHFYVNGRFVDSIRVAKFGDR